MENEQTNETSQTGNISNTSSYNSSIKKFFLDNNVSSGESSDFSKVCYKLYKLGIKSSNDGHRIIFTSTYAKRLQNGDAMNCNLTREANGLILNMDDFTPLLIPPRLLYVNHAGQAKQAGNNISQSFDIYKAMDGTCFNLYFFNKKWCISTTNGYDMNNTMWNKSTYQELIDECLAQHGLTWETFTSKLEKTHCYTFGFKHVKFHPFIPSYNSTVSIETYNTVWFIQSVELSTGITCNNVSPIASIKPQPRYENQNATRALLFKEASEAYQLYLNEINKEEDEHADHATVTASLTKLSLSADKTPNVCYGFILKSKTGELNDILIESSLLIQIRKIWYCNDVIKRCHVNKYDKTKTIMLNAYLTPKLYQVFTSLFPQYHEEMTDISNKVNTLVNTMYCKTFNKTLINIENKELFVAVATHLLGEFKKLPYNVNESTAHRAYSTFVIHPDFLETLLPLM